MKDTFLPDNYEVPSASGKYYRLQQGSNQFRVLASPILGNEYWSHEGKPVRKRTGENIVVDDIRPEKDGSVGKVKHFWAMPVWDGVEVKVFEITQKQIQTAIKDLVKDEDWSDPKNYDIVINREGEGLETKYSVKPKIHKELSKEAIAGWESTKKNGFDLDALYNAGDPFNPSATPKVAEEVFENNPEEIDLNGLDFGK